MAAKYKKRPDGRYLIQIKTGYYDNGKPKYKNIYAHSIKELEQKASEFRTQLERGTVIENPKMTVEEWSLLWLELYKSNTEYNTHYMYKSVINVHIIPAIGHFKLSELKSHHIQQMINTKIGEGLTRTIEKIKVTLNQILEQAVKNEYIYKNVINNVEFPKKQKNEKRSLTEEEKQWIYKADFDLKEKALVYMLLYTGIRRGEAAALTKKDIDLKNRTVSIDKNVIFKGNTPELKDTPKSFAGNRLIPITNELYIVLLEYLPTINSLYVFPHRNGGLITQKSLVVLWEHILKKINIAAGGIGDLKIVAGDITPHIFRHTYATMLYNASIDIKTAQYLLGHSSISVTMDIYTHLDKLSNITARDKLDIFLSNKNIPKNNISYLD